MTMSARPTVCLNMIVKDEAHVIARCLESVRDHIDYWVIVDTGSTDGTREAIGGLIGDLPGELHEREWKDFGANRTQALELARGKADYMLIIDADEELIVPDEFEWPDLQAGAYSLLHSQGRSTDHTFWRMSLLRDRDEWRYVGVLHEYPASKEPADHARLPGPVIAGHFDSARNRQTNEQKYLADAEVLLAGLDEEPDNERYVFYLAQSYRDAGKLDEAARWYEKRIEMGRWDEEVWFSRYQLATIAEARGLDEEAVIGLFLKAHDCRPQRAEALGALAGYLRARDRFASAKVFGQAAMAIPRPEDDLFIDSSFYTWRPLDEVAVADYWLGNYEASADACNTLLERSDIPMHERIRITRNLMHAMAKQYGVDVPSEADYGAEGDGAGDDETPSESEERDGRTDREDQA